MMDDDTRAPDAPSMMPVGGLRMRPPFSTLFPIDEEVLERIIADMRSRGFDRSKPIDVWGPGGVVIDGHTRLRAAVAVGIREVPVFRHDFADEIEALHYAIHNQRDRRNLSPAELLRCIEAVDAAYRQPRGGRNPEGRNQYTATAPPEVKTSREVLTSHDGASSARTAAIVGVSRATVERARAVLADPEARQAVEAGASIKAAYRQVQEKRREAQQQQREQSDMAPPVPGPATITPVEEALRRAAIPGAFTVAEWQALDAKTKELLLTEAPLLGGEKTFNRTNENVDWAWWTWNPVTGCLHDCPYCYARDIANRFYPQKFVPTFVPARLFAPRYSRVPARAREDYREGNVFACSMADLFGKWVPQEWIDAVFREVIRAAEWRFLFLTKFPRKLAEQDWPPNAWVGTTVDRQFRVEIAERAFREVRAGVKWLSCEPLLEPLRFTSLEMFDWVVIGAESPSSRNPRGFQPPWEWVVDLYLQAREAGCRVYLKENLTFADRPKELPAALEDLHRLGAAS